MEVSTVSDFRVNEIVVEAQHKSWTSGATVRGDSGGTTVSWKVVPPEEKEFWTPKEAASITLKARRELHAMLIMDSRARGVEGPEGGVEALASYSKAVEVAEEDA